MNPPPLHPQDNVIRITREEATSSHVDDLLKRQMSLRGESGVTRDRTRRWYYQNWFVFAIVGGMGAFLAWFLMERYFQDQIYFQGKIKEHITTAGGPAKDKHGIEFYRPPTSRLVVNGQAIWLVPGAREMGPDGKLGKVLDVSKLEVGQEAGFYLEDHAFVRNGESEALASYVKLNPPPQSAERAKLTVSDLMRTETLVAFLLFPVVGGFVGLLIGAVDGLICRMPRRALTAGIIGLLAGFVGSFVTYLFAEIIYSPISHYAIKQMAEAEKGGGGGWGFGIQVLGRTLAWGMAGLCMGLGQGIALRSKRLLIYGLIGGVAGGLLGGLLFDPIGMFFTGKDRADAGLSRMIGFTVIGVTVGAMIGLVELLARDAWLAMTEGPLRGKEFLIFKDIMKVGASPRSDLYLFNDPLVAENHAVIRALGEDCEIEAVQNTHPLAVNSSLVRRSRLRHGDTVTIGKTVFVFQKRRG